MTSASLRIAALAGLLALVASQAQAAPQPPRVFAKAGGGFDERIKDRARCRAIAQAAPASDLPQTGQRASASGYAADLPTAIGGAIAFAIIAAIDTSIARGRAEAFCLVNLGYAAVPLTPEEAKAYPPVGDKREAWERAFLASDLTARVNALRTPVAPPLPPYRPEPGTHGGLKMDLESLAAMPGEISQGGVALTARASRWRSAVLTQPFATTDGPIRVAGETGAVFHQVDYRPQKSALLRDQGATWCGPVTQTAQGGGAAPQVYCFTTQAEGYEIYRPSGYAWLAGAYRDGFILPRFRQPILLEERQADDEGPLEVDIQVLNVWASHMLVAASARRPGGDRSVHLWAKDLKLDEAGKATLPLWSRKAVFTRAGPKAVTVALEPGDGKGWRDED